MSRTPTRQPRPMVLGALQPGKTPTLVYPDGVAVPGAQRITTTAQELAQSLAHHIAGAYLAGRESGIKAGLKVGATAGAQVGHRAGVKVGAEAGATAGVKVGAAAGVKAGAQHVVNNSRVRRTIERDSEGRITGTIEDRVATP